MAHRFTPTIQYLDGANSRPFLRNHVRPAKESVVALQQKYSDAHTTLVELERPFYQRIFTNAATPLKYTFYVAGAAALIKYYKGQ